MKNELYQAVNNNQLYLEYQPQVDIVSGSVTGVEALLRWQHPLYGRIPPNEFIPLAEDTGEIVSIGKWVLREACTQAKLWSQDHLNVPSVAVNVSALQLQHPDFIRNVRSALEDNGLEPSDLEIEISERQFISHKKAVIPALADLQKLGVVLAMDNFSGAYSGLGYLRDFQFSKLKIDRSFIDTMLVDPRDALLTATIVDLAKTLQIRAVAECVETADQVTFLQTVGCEEAQGYHISRPVDPKRFAAQAAIRSIPYRLHPALSSITRVGEPYIAGMTRLTEPDNRQAR